MLYLYPKNAVDFTNNGDPIRHSFDEHVIRDDGFYLTFNLLLDKEEEYKKVKKEMIVAAETPDGRNQFRVYDVKKKSTQVEITAVQLMYDFDNKEVNPFSVKNASGAQIINRFKSSFKSTLGQFTMDSSVTELHDFATNEEEDDTPSHNALETLNRITKRWDSELMLNGFDIRMIKRLGSKTDALLYEKKNISEFEDASSVSGMATRIHATSKFTPEGKEDEVILSVTVDSPLINEYAQIYEKSYVNNDAKTEAELIAWVKLKYSTENIDKPSRTITVETNIIDGTEINYGDDLVMKYLVHDVDEVIRCVGYDYDPIKNTYYSVTLGDWKDSFATTLTGGIVDTTNRKFNQIKNNITYISMSANGKNRNAYGPEPVPNPINGDNWYYYEFDRPDDVEYRVYQDGFWVKLDFFAAKKEVTEALDKADEAKQEAIDSYNKSITDAKAYTEQKANEFNNQMEIVKADVADTVIKANDAVVKANQSIADVGFMQIDLNATKQNAIDALTKAQTITENFNTLSTSFDELTQTVGFKAEQATVDTVTRQVDRHELSIAANAREIDLKMTSTQVDSLVSAKGYVNQAQLTATSDKWNLALTQVSSDLEGLEIGGRNLLKKTSTTWKRANSGGLWWTSINGHVLLTLEELGIKPGDTITFGMDILPSDSGARVRITKYKTDGNYTASSGNTIPVGGEGRSEITTKIDNDIVKITFGFDFDNAGKSSTYIDYRYEKVEKGTKATDWTPAPEDMATLEQFTTIDATVRGLQTTVGNKADKTEMTQLANQWTQTTALVNGHTGQISNLGEQINLRVTSTQVTEAILSNKKIQDTRNDNQSPTWYFTNYPRQTVEEFKFGRVIGALPQIDASYGVLTTKVPWTETSGGAITQTFSTSSGVYQRKGSTAWGTWDKVAEAGKLISQINISPESILIASNKITLSGDTYMDAAFINKMKVHSVDAVVADIATVRTKMLTADVITSTMLKSDTAMINKLFATTALIDTLTSKAAFINSVKAIDIAADRITAGTLNAAKVTIINLDASRITTGTLSGANYALNLNTGSETFRNPNNGNTLLIQQDKFYFDTNSASHYLIPDNEGFALVPGTGNTGNNRNAGIRLKSTNFNYLDLGLGSDGGFQYRIGGYANNFAFMSKNSGDFVFSHTAIGDSNVGSHMWKLQDGNYGTLNYGKTNLVINGYDGSVVPKVSVFNPANGQLATFDTQFLNLTGPTGTIELSQAGGSFKITHGVNRNWVFAQGNNGTVTYGTTMIALNGHNNASARLSVYGSNGTTYGYMSAANFDVQSERKHKSSITDLGGALSILSTMKIHQYIKNGISEIGIITDEAPLQLLSDNNTKVSLYDFISLTAKGTQELTDISYLHERKLNNHDTRLAELEKENKLLKQKIEKLESAA